MYFFCLSGQNQFLLSHVYLMFIDIFRQKTFHFKFSLFYEKWVEWVVGRKMIFFCPWINYQSFFFLSFPPLLILFISWHWNNCSLPLGRISFLLLQCNIVKVALHIRSALHKLSRPFLLLCQNPNDLFGWFHQPTCSINLTSH